MKLGTSDVSKIYLGTSEVSRVMLGANEVWSGIDSDAAAIIAAMTTAPDSTRQTLIDTTVRSLKTAGIWTKLDGLWMLAAHAEQAGLLNWKTQVAATKISTPTFETDRGFTGGAGKAINTGLVLSTLGGNATQDSCMLASYSRSDVNASEITIGARDAATTNQTVLYPRVSGNLIGRINQNSSTGTSTAVADSLGMSAANRSGSTASQSYRNGSALGTSATVSNGLPQYAIYLLAANQAGVVNSPTTRQIAFGAVGGSLNATEHADLYTIVQAYMTSIGANV